MGFLNRWVLQNSKRPHKYIHIKKDPVNCVNFDPEGNFLVSSSSDLTIKLWDANNDFQNCKTFNGHDHNVSYVNFLGTDNLISCSRDRTIKLW